MLLRGWVDPLPALHFSSGGGGGSQPYKVINSNIEHAAKRAVERAGFSSISDARNALRAFGKNIEINGLPDNFIFDSARSDQIIVPGFGDGGAVVYQVTKNGKLKLKTVLIWKGP